MVAHDFNYKDWLARRKTTTKVFIVVQFALGIEYSMTFTTLYVYLKDVIHVKNNLNAFYSSICGIYVLTQIVASLVLCRLFDKYRTLKLFFILITFITFVGNVLYTIPYSPYFLLAGRFLSGAGGCLRPIILSELTRSYPSDEVITQMSAMSFSYGIGFTVGPAINIAFVKARFTLIGIPINYANGAGLALSIAFLMAFILSLFFLSDLSKEFDLKEERQKKTTDKLSGPPRDEELEKDSLDSTNEDFANAPLLSGSLLENSTEIDNVLCRLFSSIDIVLIFVFAFFAYITMLMQDLWIPMAVIKLLHWKVLEINLIFLLNGIIISFICLFLVFKPPSKNQLVNLGISSFIATCYMYGIYLYFRLVGDIEWLNVTLWIINPFMKSTVVIVDELFTMSVLAQMVPSKIQALTESVRLMFSRLGATLALFTAAFAFEYILYVCPSCMVISLVLMFFLIWRKKHFQNPKMIIS
ncbi:sugar efflux transporter B-like [Clytia hemisphaerica]|uniref:Major facilitator superfamily (MFS) profile domain-containing protein n=1 Tax=Clytia hemisphaerica TaxID=252671 RepID=A0A7M5XAH1_9CNID